MHSDPRKPAPPIKRPPRCLPDRRAALLDRFQLLVDCRDERGQRELFEQLKSQGYECRVLTI